MSSRILALAPLIAGLVIAALGNQPHTRAMSLAGKEAGMPVLKLAKGR